MQKITSHLWFDKEAREAAEFYVSTFENSKINSITTLQGTPSGEVDVVSLAVLGHDFTFISAGPVFKFTPAISFLVSCKTKEEVVALWDKLSVGGVALMEMGEYPFSEKYGWIADKYGLSWQIMFMGDREIKQAIVPTLMFIGDHVGQAEEAINFYVSVFKNSKVGNIMRYEKNEGPDREGTVKHASFTIEGQDFAAMDSAYKHEFKVNEAISFLVNCDTQEEIDYYWKNLSADQNSEQCGWLKDKYGVSWQISPTILEKMLTDADKDRVARVTEAFLKMKKLNIKDLEFAYNGK